MPTELQELRMRLEKARRALEEQTAVAELARELLAKASTYPRRRREVEAELNTAVIFDIPMLTEVIAECEAGLALFHRPEPAT
ncbi:MAG: hypothetical protein ACREOQ_17685 [Gemmatimonadales bacterium]